MSATVCVAPILGALVGAEDVLGPNRLWRPENENQRQITDLFQLRDELNAFWENNTEGGVKHKELRYWVDWVAENLNKILREEGFNIQLDDFRRDEFGIVSILDVLVEWLVNGKADEILVGDVFYPAIRMDSQGEVDGQHLQFVEVFTSTNHPSPVGMIRTKSGDRVFITVARDERFVEMGNRDSSNWPPQGFDLYNVIEDIRQNLHASNREWSGMVFPMVDIDDKPDIGWLKGMWTLMDDATRAEISQALQQTKFKMNEFGARVKSAVALAMTLSVSISESVPQWLFVDRPFYLWIEREGVSFPVVGMYVDYSDWKNPGNLSDI